MNRASIYKLLGYDGHLLTIDDACVRYPDYYDLNKIPVDKVYFAKSYPTVLFMEVERFGNPGQGFQNVAFGMELQGYPVIDGCIGC